MIKLLDKTSNLVPPKMAGPKITAGGHLALPLLYFAIAFQFTQLILFNFLSEDLRLALAALTLAATVPAAIIVSSNRQGGYLLFWFAAAMMCLAWAGSWLLVGYPSQSANMAQNLSAVTWPIILLGLISQVRAVLPVVLASTTVIVAALVAIIVDPITFGGLIRPASFTGGMASPHSAAYALIGAMFVLWFGTRSRLKWLLLGIGLLLVLSFASRTAWAMAAAFIVVEGGKIIYKRAGLLALTPLIPLALAGAVFLLNTRTDWNEFSSGRLSVYAERVGELSASNLGTLVFGRGAGSDVQPSDQWWWSEKVSHNDLLGAITERGLLGALSLLLYIVALFHYSAGRGRTVAVAILTAAMLSGIIIRPLSLFFLFFALAIGTEQARPISRSLQRAAMARRRRAKRHLVTPSQPQ